ncbi:MAG: hypothetical protein NTW14_04320 [bacterium]|nr:hypothetical protein [bacterium]
MEDEEIKKMAEIQAAKTHIRRTYKSIWTKWYKDSPESRRAKICIRVEAGEAYCRIDGQLIVLYLDEYNLLQAKTNIIFRGENKDWPIWKRDLIHEMFHEYEFKVIKDNPTAKGIELYNEYSGFFMEPEKHPIEFFSAVAAKSGYFPELTERELIDNIK